jgi:hypothetical protein
MAEDADAKKDGDGDADAKKDGDGDADAKKDGDPMANRPKPGSLGDLEEDLDVLNIILIGTDDREPFINYEIPKSILQKVKALVALGVPEIAKNADTAMAIGDLNESLYNLLKDPILLKQAMDEEDGLTIEKGSLRATLDANRQLGADPDPIKLKGKIHEGEKYNISDVPAEKALEATLLV